MPILDAKIVRVEEALKMNLYKETVAYLKNLENNFSGRGSGRTFAIALRALLFDSAFPLDLTNRTILEFMAFPGDSMRALLSAKDLCLDIHSKLKSAGIPVRRVISGRVLSKGNILREVTELRAKSGLPTFACKQAWLINQLNPDIPALKYLKANYLGVNIKAHSKEQRAYFYLYGRES